LVVSVSGVGHFFSLFFEGAGHAGGDTRYERMGTDLRGYYPLRNNRFVTGWRFEMEGENGEDVPFYEQSLLGGKDSLRGYGDARFVDRNRLSYTLEERIRFYRLNAFNVNVDFEVTPFYEAGTVAGRLSDFKSEKLHHVAGVGFRSVVRPSVVGVVDIGFGDEGLALFVGIDYPF
jgi:outer membrane protein assembly factor BamA